MKFCYLDESGTTEHPFPVMVGVIVDAYRMHITKGHWQDVLDILSEIVGRPISEFHAKEFYHGRGVWHDLDGAHRADIITELLTWFADRGHSVVFSAIDTNQFKSTFNSHRFSANVGTYWRLMGLHVVLSLQKHHQSEGKNKGNTVLIFDEQVIEKGDFTKLLCDPPEWSDTYYDKKTGQDQLDQIVDVPHFVDSKQVLLIQVADLMALIMRRHLELEQGGDTEKYTGERAKIANWVDLIISRSINNSAMFPKRSLCDAAKYFKEFVPDHFWS